MPPLNGIDRGLNGEVLKALYEAGHNSRIAVVDASYHIPHGSRVVEYSGVSTAGALRGIVELVPVEGDVVLMKSGEPGPCRALSANIGVANGLEVDYVTTSPHGEAESDNEIGRRGFYDIVNDPDKKDYTLFVRTIDELPFACAMFVVGHSQIAERQ